MIVLVGCSRTEHPVSEPVLIIGVGEGYKQQSYVPEALREFIIATGVSASFKKANCSWRDNYCVTWESNIYGKPDMVYPGCRIFIEPGDEYVEKRAFYHALVHCVGGKDREHHGMPGAFAHNINWVHPCFGEEDLEVICAHIECRHRKSTC